MRRSSFWAAAGLMTTLLVFIRALPRLAEAATDILPTEVTGILNYIDQFVFPYPDFYTADGTPVDTGSVYSFIQWTVAIPTVSAALRRIGLKLIVLLIVPIIGVISATAYLLMIFVGCHFLFRCS